MNKYLKRLAGCNTERDFNINLLVLLVLFLLIVVTLDLITPRSAHAEYGDVVINNYSDQAGMRPVVFSHWFHRIRFRCKVCHADIGFEFKAGGNDIDMLKIIDGEYCGACHDGEVAWSVEQCDLCHSGQPGTETHVHGSTLQKLKAPLSTGVK
ncbi:hypothetical protein JYT79_00550 [Cardiobacterium sp. AH-315-I02]|nr:hypothetical protein [Cardiobacterium sp. AH-315-I02]